MLGAEFGQVRVEVGALQSGRAVALHDQEAEPGGKQAFRLVEAGEDAGAEMRVRTVRVAFAVVHAQNAVRGEVHEGCAALLDRDRGDGRVRHQDDVVRGGDPRADSAAHTRLTRLTRLTRPPEPS
ncbi:hypothetical protein C0R04_13245 [Streptomyces albidoflavus]|nr:hypothetical protein C0R04_13245 [Streptomyces albidoflavus]RZE96297.1 hypothetical protein C0R03_13270 [Streptomyces albidoflavus]